MLFESYPESPTAGKKGNHSYHIYALIRKHKLMLNVICMLELHN